LYVLELSGQAEGFVVLREQLKEAGGRSQAEPPKVFFEQSVLSGFKHPSDPTLIE